MSRPRPDRAHRPLVRALTLSALAHALLLVGVAVPLPLALAPAAGEARVQASLRAPSATGRAEAPAAASRPPSAVATTLPVPATPKPRQTPRGTPVLAALEAAPDGPSRPVVAAARAEHAPEAAPALAPSGAARDAPMETKAGDGRRPAAGTPGEGRVGGVAGGEVRADDLRHYRVSLASAARRFKRYPPLARERGWEGTSEVAVVLRAGVPHPDVRLMRSSGRELLDAQAMDMVAQAVRVAEMPSGLRGRDLRIELPVRFSLEDER